MSSTTGSILETEHSSSTVLQLQALHGTASQEHSSDQGVKTGSEVGRHGSDPGLQTSQERSGRLRGGRGLLLGLHMALVMMSNSFTTGLVTIGIKQMAEEVQLDKSLVYWPVLAYGLTASPLLLPLGSVADVLGPRYMNLAGCLGCGIFVLACGLSRNGSELIAFRCLQGVASALFLPTSMGIISSGIATGKLRNVAIATLSCGQVIGYALGLVLGGIFLGTIGWRSGYYLCGALQIALFALGFWAIPSSLFPSLTFGLSASLEKLKNEIDWIGSLISCVVIGMVSYVLAMIAEDSGAIKSPSNATLLAVSIAGLPCFALWMRHREKIGKPALIPNSLWKTTFTSICIMITLAFAEMQAVELLASLFFQNVQGLSPLDSSLRLLPGLIVAFLNTLVIGHFIHKLPMSLTMAILSTVAGVSPLLMAFVNPVWPYWYEAFPAQVLYPVAVDLLFIASALIVSESFLERDQALAGAVLNTIANLGQSLGLAVIAIISNTVTQAQDDATSPNGLLAGYRAGYFVSFAIMIITAIIGAFGLRKMGKIGIKQD